MVTPVLSGTDRARIREAVALAERKTAGEIFVVVAHASDDYRFVPLFWATLVALFTPLPLIFLTRVGVLDIYLIQLLAFVAAAIVLSLAAVRFSVVPAPLKRARGHAVAVEQFLAHGLHMTEARTGVLVFVSLAERYAEIVADGGIAAKVEQAVWDRALAGLTGEVAAGRLADGLIAAIGHAGAVLALHFPPRTGDRNELANDVVLI